MSPPKVQQDAPQRSWSLNRKEVLTLHKCLCRKRKGGKKENVESKLKKEWRGVIQNKGEERLKKEQKGGMLKNVRRRKTIERVEEKECKRRWRKLKKKVKKKE